MIMKVLLKQYIRIAVTAIRQNWLSGLILQGFAVIIVLSYYFVPAFQSLLGNIAEWKQKGGYLFSAVSTALFGGLFPLMIQLWFERERLRLDHMKTGLFIVGFWAYRGVEVDLFYRFQAFWHGDNHAFLTILKKTMTDQFVYAPFWSILIVTLGILFKECGLSFRKTRSQLNRSFITVTYPSIVISTWLLWIPAVSVIYALPALLQIPMMNLVVCFYSILLLYMTHHRNELSKPVEST